MTSRDIEKAEAALDDLEDGSRLQILQLDLSSLDSVRACAEQFKSKSAQLDILIENAGAMACAEGRTADGSRHNLVPIT